MSINKINKIVIAQEMIDFIDSKISENDFDNAKTDIQNMIDEINNNLGAIRKPPVSTYDDLAVVYPTPKQGWWVKVEDSGLQYQYDEVQSQWYLVTLNPVPTSSDTTDGLMKKEDKIKLDAIEEYAEKNNTPQELLDVIKTLVGSGSGFDADTVDGKHATDFAPVIHDHDGLYHRKTVVDVRLNSKANLSALTNHINDEAFHINIDEKDKWNKSSISIGNVEPDDGSILWLDTSL